MHKTNNHLADKTIDAFDQYMFQKATELELLNDYFCKLFFFRWLAIILLPLKSSSQRYSSHWTLPYRHHPQVHVGERICR